MTQTREAILVELSNGLAVWQIAAKFGVAPHTIDRWLLPGEARAAQRSRTLKRRELRKANRRDANAPAIRARAAEMDARDAMMRERRRGGAPLSQIASEFRLTKERVRQIVGPAGDIVRKRTDKRQAELRRRYEALPGMPMWKAVKILGTSSSRLYNAGCKAKVWHRDHRPTLSDKAAELYRKGMTLQQIADAQGRTRNAVGAGLSKMRSKGAFAEYRHEGYRKAVEAL